MQLVYKQLPGQQNITRYSFWIDYIIQLWKDSKNIKFVKQTIGHRNLDANSAYIKNLNNLEVKSQ